MSKIRYGQTQDTSHISHKHNGTDGSEVLDYTECLYKHITRHNNVRQSRFMLEGNTGVIDFSEHRCGYYPIVRCVVGGNYSKISIKIVDGNIHWASNISFTRADSAYLVVLGYVTRVVDKTVEGKWAEHY